MKYVFRTVVGLGLELGSIVAISYGIYQLLQVGTCATGGPYVVARECPEGTDLLGLALPAGVIVMLVGAVIYGNRGAAPGSGKEGSGAGGAVLLLWTGLFLGCGFASFWGVWGPDANPGPGGELGGLIVGFLFVPMGLLPVLILLVSYRREIRGKLRGGFTEEIANQLQGKPPISPQAREHEAHEAKDKLAELERIHHLRAEGALDRSEFERLKAEVMEW